MARTSKHLIAPFHWDLPAPDRVVEALAYFHVRPPLPARQTLPFGLHKPRGWRERELLGAHLYGMSMIDRILDMWREDWQQPRADGALAQVMGVQDKGRYKSSTFAEVVRKSFPQPSDDPFLSRYYDSVCRAATEKITSWAQTMIKRTIAAHRKKQQAEQHRQAAAGGAKRSQVSATKTKLPRYVPTLADVYRVWAEEEQTYQRAAAALIPFGRSAGETIADHGKREARWILDRLLPEADIAELLADVERLLDDESDVLHGEAAFAEHLWQQEERNADGNQHHRRAVREGRLMQRILDPAGDLVLLGTLHKNELSDLRSQLREMQEHTVAFKAAMQRLEATLAETQEVTGELKDLREALETFLYAKPPEYPSVKTKEWSEAHRAMLRETFEIWQQWFYLDQDKPEHAERFLSERLETRSKNGMLRAESALKPPEWQPISCIGTMRPGQYRDFALLYDRKTYHYTLAVVLHKPGSFGENHEPSYREETTTARQKEQQDYRERRANNPLYFVNFPETPFNPPKGTSVLYFPLTCVQEYQGVILKDVIKHQRKAQRRKFATQHSTAVRPKPLEKCLPDALLKSAKILCARDKDGKPSFSVHVSVEMPPANPQPLPTRVIGFHEHDTGYSFAVLELDGTVQDVGDLRIDRHVDPAQGAKPYGDNYTLSCRSCDDRQSLGMGCRHRRRKNRVEKGAAQPLKSAQP